MYENNKEDIKKAQQGDKNALERLVLNNNGLIWSIVKRFSGRGYELEDLYQIGCLAFIKAIKRFDANFETQITTYAVPYILGEIKKFIRDDNPVKISRSIKELSMKINLIQNESMSRNGKELNINELAEILKVDREEIIIATESSRCIESLDKETNDEDKRSLIDTIVSNKDEEQSIVNKLTIKELLGKLEKREKEIILLRYYKGKTQSQVGKILGITQVQVSRIEKKVLDRMRYSLEAVWERFFYLLS